MGVLTHDQIAVVKNDLEEKGWSSYRIWKEHPSFQCSKNTIIKLVRKIKETGSGERKKVAEEKHQLQHLRMQNL